MLAWGWRVERTREGDSMALYNRSRRISQTSQVRTHRWMHSLCYFTIIWIFYLISGFSKTNNWKITKTNRMFRRGKTMFLFKWIKSWLKLEFIRWCFSWLVSKGVPSGEVLTFYWWSLMYSEIVCRVLCSFRERTEGWFLREQWDRQTVIPI